MKTKKITLLSILFMFILCFSTVIAYGNETSEELPIATYSDGRIHLDNFSMEHLDKEIPIVILDQEDSEPTVVPLFFYEFTNCVNKIPLDFNGTTWGYVTVTFDITYNDGYDEYLNYVPQNLKVSANTISTPSYIYGIRNVDVNCSPGRGSCRFRASGEAYTGENYVYKVSGSNTWRY